MSKSFRFGFATAAVMVLSGCGPVRFTSTAEKAGKLGATNDSSFRTIDETLQTANVNKIDVLVVLDNSGSMDKERAALGQKFKSFLSGLDGLDWQLCATTTDVGAQRGQPIDFTPGVRVLRSTTANAEQVFLNKMSSLPNGSGDEEGIRALSRAFSSPDTQCYRSDAALAAIILSDEDERSAGGFDDTKTSTQWRALTTENDPNEILNVVRNTWGAGKIFSAHSIVIPEGDSACHAKESLDSEVFYGRRYQALSGLTGGVVGNICADDYSAQLAGFADRVRSTTASLSLQCVPAETPTVRMPAGVSSTVVSSGDKIFFTPALPSGTSVGVHYRCPLN